MRLSWVCLFTLGLIVFPSCQATVELEVSTQDTSREHLVQHALSLVQIPPERRTWVADDPYARLTALLQQGNPAITRADVVQFVTTTLGVQLNYPSILAYYGQAPQSVISLVSQFYVNGIYNWLLANAAQLITELRNTRAALLSPQGYWRIESFNTLPSLLALWGDWYALAEQGPALLRPLLPGYVEPQLFVFGNDMGYDVGLFLRKGTDSYVITRDKMVTQQARGLVDLNSASLVLFEGSMVCGKIEVNDVIATDRYRNLERLSGGGDLEPVWDLESRAVLQFGAVRVGWSSRDWWAGLTWSGEGSWWDVHVALGWPYASADATIRTPREYPVGLGVRLRSGALWTSFLQGDVRVSPGVWLGPEWARVYGGITLAAVPTRIRGRIRGALIRRHIGVSLMIRGWELDVLVEPPRARWLVGYGQDWWRVSALGDVVNGLSRYGGRVELGPLEATVLYGLGWQGAVRFSWEF